MILVSAPVPGRDAERHRRATTLERGSHQIKCGGSRQAVPRRGVGTMEVGGLTQGSAQLLLREEVFVQQGVLPGDVGLGVGLQRRGALSQDLQ